MNLLKKKATNPKSYKDWPKIMLLNEDYRYKLHNLYLAISDLNMWDYIFENPPDKLQGYMFTNDRNFNKLKKHLLVKDDYRRGSFGFCMQKMLYISQFGFKDFKENYNTETNKIDKDIFYLKI